MRSAAGLSRSTGGARTAFSDNGKPVEYFRVLYRGDRVRFHLESHRDSDRVVRLIGSELGAPTEAGLKGSTA